MARLDQRIARELTELRETGVPAAKIEARVLELHNWAKGECQAQHHVGRSRRLDEIKATVRALCERVGGFIAEADDPSMIIATIDITHCDDGLTVLMEAETDSDDTFAASLPFWLPFDRDEWIEAIREVEREDGVFLSAGLQPHVAQLSICDVEVQ